MYDPCNEEPVGLFKGYPVFVYRSLQQTGLEKGDVLVGILDKNVFFGVPECLQYAHLKAGASEWEGMICEFIDADGRQAEIPLVEVQKMAALDLMVGNRDRNPSNILYDDNHMIPIDHDCAFMGSFDILKLVADPEDYFLMTCYSLPCTLLD